MVHPSPVSDVVLLHGWSARDKSSRYIGTWLTQNGFNAHDIVLAGYDSLEDEVAIEDVARRMDVEIRRLQKDGELDARFHLIAHSTGALVAREWLAERYRDGGSPVANFLMLAPANFGSPLAHWGRSAVHRFFRGATSGFRRGFEVGETILRQLELGSAYQERLVLRDRLSRDPSDTASPYAEDGTRPFVIVGAQPMAMASLFNESAWDGTVRIASARFDPRGVSVDFTGPPERVRKPEIRPWVVRGPNETPFLVLPDHTHLSILHPNDPTQSLSAHPATQVRLGQAVLDALKVDSAQGYHACVQAWAKQNAKTRTLAARTPESADLRSQIFGTPRTAKDDAQRARAFHEHYQVVVSARDDTGRAITDYFVWLTAYAPSHGNAVVRLDDAIMPAEAWAHAHVMQDLHVNAAHCHRRVLHLDRMALMGKDGIFGRHASQARDAVFAAGLTASAPGDRVAYFTADEKEGVGLVPLRAADVKDYDDPGRFLKRFTTHFVEVIAPRAPDQGVFTTTRYDDLGS